MPYLIQQMPQSLTKKKQIIVVKETFNCFSTSCLKIRQSSTKKSNMRTKTYYIYIYIYRVQERHFFQAMFGSRKFEGKCKGKKIQMKNIRKEKMNKNKKIY